jgi:hypothetical protein
MSTDKFLLLSLPSCSQPSSQIYLPSPSIAMPSSSTADNLVYLSIAYTLDMLLSCPHPLIPWLAIRQSNCSLLRIGQKIGLEHAHGLPFSAQSLPIFGRICAVSHLVQGFVIVMASVDPQTFKAFKSTIYIAIPRQWITIPLRPAFTYQFAYRSLPKPRFLHLLDPSHEIYRMRCLQEDITGSRMAKKVLAMI